MLLVVTREIMYKLSDKW